MDDACMTLPCLLRKDEEFSDGMSMDEPSSDLGEGMSVMLQKVKLDDGVKDANMMDVRRAETCSLLLPSPPSVIGVDASLACITPCVQHDLLNPHLVLDVAINGTLGCKSVEASALPSLQPWTGCERSLLGMKNGFVCMSSHLPVLRVIAMLAKGSLDVKQQWHNSAKSIFLLSWLLTVFSLCILSTLGIPSLLLASRNMEKINLKLQVAPSHKFWWTVLAWCLDYFLPFWWLAVCIKWLHQMERPIMIRPALAFFPLLQ
jgi:hypothetical protein